MIRFQFLRNEYLAPCEQSTPPPSSRSPLAGLTAPVISNAPTQLFSVPSTNVSNSLDRREGRGTKLGVKRRDEETERKREREREREIWRATDKSDLFVAAASVHGKSGAALTLARRKRQPSESRSGRVVPREILANSLALATILPAALQLTGLAIICYLNEARAYRRARSLYPDLIVVVVVVVVVVVYGSRRLIRR